jgi:hypothetical protein
MTFNQAAFDAMMEREAAALRARKGAGPGALPVAGHYTAVRLAPRQPPSLEAVEAVNPMNPTKGRGPLFLIEGAARMVRVTPVHSRPPALFLLVALYFRLL